MLDDEHGVALVDQTAQHGEQAVDVLEVQPRGGLVEQVHGVPRGALGQLRRQFHALGLAPRESRCALTQPNVPQTNVHESLHVPRDGRLVGEEVEGLGDRHVQDLCDVPPLERDLESVPVVARALAHLARHVHVRQEVHLDLDGAVAGARLAPAALDVEAEAPGLVAAHLRLWRCREELPDAVEHAGVRGRVRARRAADRRLVHVDDLVDRVDALHCAVLPGRLLRLVDPLHHGRQEDVPDERALPAARHARHRDEAPERDFHVDVTEVVLARAPDSDDLAGGRASSGGNRDRTLSGDVGAGDGVLDLLDPLDGPAVDDRPSVLARARSDVDDPVGLLDGVLVVLHDDHGVPQVAEPVERVDQPAVVPLVQPDAGLVEHVQGAHQARADLAGQPDALGLPAREGAGGS